ncbi:MAG: ABC transporter ATP-binding protein, partial [Alphaproteobacteria bacterium]|nr:ABC transporter ATP-binding protein [Alphaproteobacteria bacterium]
VEAGEIHALIGPNGAGKTTLFNLISGLYPLDAGSLHFRGVRYRHPTPERLAQAGLVRSFQQPKIFPNQSVLENLNIARLGKQRSYTQWWHAPEIDPQVADLLVQIGLADHADTPACNLAHGQQKQLDLGLCLALEPTLLMLDEPTASMSQSETVASIALLRKIAREREMSLLFTEHDMQVVFGMADRITVLLGGRVLASDTPKAIRRNPAVQAAYLSGGQADAASRS